MLAPPRSTQPPALPHVGGNRHQWARYYASRGWSVLPLHSTDAGLCSCGDRDCRSPGKHPRTQHGVKDASVDPQQIQDWWTQWPAANVGIATGAVSGLVVIDIDPRNGGNESYAQLKNELPSAFAKLFEVRSGGGGTHLYFQHPGGHIPCRANIRPGIDVKADGGYVVAPNSSHVSGSIRYRPISNIGMALPALDPALRDLIAPGAQAQPSKNPSPKIELDRLRVSDATKTLIRDGKPKGQRSEAIFGAIRALIKSGYSDDEITAVLVDPANRLSEKPLEKGPSWLKGEIDRARQKPDQDSHKPGPANTNADVLVSRRASDIQPEAIRWLWPQRIALGKISLIAGPPGLGKSQLTAYMAAIISTGGTWPTGETCPAGDVLILSAEDDPADTIRPRLEACGARLDRIHIFEAIKNKNNKA